MIKWGMVFLVFGLGLLSGTALAAESVPSNCRDYSSTVYRVVPGLFYYNQPDSLLTVLLAWEDICGEAEPVLRLKILASIWDGAFTEDVYGSRIIDALIWRYDPQRNNDQDGEVDPDLASGGIASPADFALAAASFDTFTTNLADQLLPHTSPGTVERFFCLFYSGLVDEAYELLHEDELVGTDLRWFYQREMSSLNQEDPNPILSLTGGFWRPKGDLLRVGAHAQVGFLLGVRHDRWLGRLVGEFRPGRSDYPYYVEMEDISGWSDRFDNFYLGLEVGREVVKIGPHRVDLFLGLGFDGIKPFREEDLVLGTVNANMGLGYRVFLGPAQCWVAGVDYRLEYLGARNNGGTSLSGEANCLRFSLGYLFDSGNGRRLAGLGH